jgi:hypothetical protein
VGFEPLKLQALPEVEDDCYAAGAVVRSAIYITTAIAVKPTCSEKRSMAIKPLVWHVPNVHLMQEGHARGFIDFLAELPSMGNRALQALGLSTLISELMSIPAMDVAFTHHYSI